MSSPAEDGRGPEAASGSRSGDPRRTGAGPDRHRTGAEDDPGTGFPLLPDRSVALVHDWLVTWGGSELVLRELARLFPEAPIYTAMWRPDERTRRAFGHRDVRTTFLDRLPGVDRFYRWTLPAMPAAFRSLDLTDFDVVISSSHAFSKAVRTRPDALHLCYCHTPPRYLWDLASFYNRGLTGALRMPLVWLLRRTDRRAAAGVDRFVANSGYVRDRIRRTYDRAAAVVHPPVEVERFREAGRDAETEGGGSGTPDGRAARGDGAAPSGGDYYLAGGRMVAYKELEVAVEAANRAGLRLQVFGDGPERQRLEELAGPTVEVLGRVSDGTLADLLAGCRAFLFPGVEDFGILPVVAQAAGSPVVARNEGGARETVVDGATGVLYEGGGPDDLLAGIERLEDLEIDAGACREQASRFDAGAFREGMAARVKEAVAGRASLDAARSGSTL